LRWRQAESSIRLASSAWSAVVGMGLVVGLQFLIYPWVYERATRGGETAIPPALWLAIDFLLVIWLFAPQLACLVLGVAAWATWRVVVRRDELLTSRAARGLMFGGALISSLGAVVLAVLIVPSAFVQLTRPLLCETNTFEEAVSPNGRYKAIVAEVDCGAMSGSHRQVLLTRRPFWWASASLLYFNQHPSLHLSWSGRTLTISGDRTLTSMDHPPPDPMIWGGVLARYAGSKE